MSSSADRARQHLLAQLRKEGVHDENVLAALNDVPRERFVPPSLRHRAYDNVALPIGEDQTISQPFVVAHMVQALKLDGTEHVLEIGTGSGYGAAVLARVAADVVTVERHAGLAAAAALLLREIGCNNVCVVTGDGSLGWPPRAPYDAIVVTASAPEVPEPLVGQLRARGRLVVPVGTLEEQHLVVIERTDTQLHSRDLGHVRFVPLIGAAGFRMLDPSRRN